MTYEQAARRCDRKAHKHPCTYYYVIRNWNDAKDRVEYFVVDEPTLHRLNPYPWDILRYQVLVGPESHIEKRSIQ